GGAIVATVDLGSETHPAAPAAPQAIGVGEGTGQAAVDALTRNIEMSQAALRAAPEDYQSWATIGLDYVQQAKITINPAYYPKAKGALATSLRLHPAHNYVAMAGEAALNAAEHHFRAALRWAKRGLAI